MRHLTHRPGLSLVEVLVVLGIAAIILSIVLPLLSDSRDQSRRAVCHANARSHVSLMLMYAADYRDFWPYPMVRDRGESDVLTIDGEPFSVIPERVLDSPGIFVLPVLFHAAMNSHSYLGDLFHPTLVCPSDLLFTEYVSRSPRALGTTSYSMSMSMVFAPEAFDPGSDPKTTHPLLDQSKWRGTRISELVFPSMKAAAFESVPYHNRGVISGLIKSAPPWKSVVGAADGAVAWRSSGTAEVTTRIPTYDPSPNPLQAHTDSFNNTGWGVRGRDW